jgi:hypothetical protein
MKICRHGFAVGSPDALTMIVLVDMRRRHHANIHPDTGITDRSEASRSWPCSVGFTV